MPSLQGTSLEAETRQAQAYLSVALKLFDPDASIDPSVADLVSRQVEQIMQAAGQDASGSSPILMTIMELTNRLDTMQATPSWKLISAV